MGLGDEIIAAGMAQRMWKTDPMHRRVVIYDRRGFPRWHEIWTGNPAILSPAEFKKQRTTVPFQRLVNSSGCRPYIRYPFSASTGWRFNKSFHARDYIASIYLTEGEKRLGQQMRDKHGPYVLLEPWTKHVNFRWPMERWAQVVEACRDITFLQHTHRDSRLVPGAIALAPMLQRQVCGLIASALTYARSESGMCHAAAALGCPTVTLWGGCMDVDVLGGYPLQISLVDREDPKSPCGSWNPCPHCKAAMERITVEMVVAAIRTSIARRSEAA